MSRLTSIISLVSVFIIAFSGISVSAVSSLKDYYSTGDDNDSSLWMSYQIRGQTWTASSSYQLSYIEIYMCRVGNPSDVILYFRNTSDESPSATNLFSVQLSASNISTDKSWVRFDLPIGTAININTGSVYWWGISTVSDNSKSDYYVIRFDKDDGYNGGSVINSDDAGKNWVKSSGYDSLFQIYGEEAATETVTVTETITTIRNTTQTLDPITSTITVTTDPKTTQSVLPITTIITITTTITNTDTIKYTQDVLPTVVTTTMTFTQTSIETITSNTDNTKSNSSILFIVLAAIGGLLAGAVIWQFLIKDRILPPRHKLGDNAKVASDDTEDDDKRKEKKTLVLTTTYKVYRHIKK